MNVRIAIVTIAIVLSALAAFAMTSAPRVEFENDIVRVLRVRLGAGESTPRHTHAAYCAIEITDSSLREGDGPISESKAGQVFCGDALAHAPRNVGKGMAGEHCGGVQEPPASPLTRSNSGTVA